MTATPGYRRWLGNSDVSAKPSPSPATRPKTTEFVASPLLRPRRLATLPMSAARNTP